MTAAMNENCVICGKKLEREPHQIRGNWRAKKYCSAKCRSRAPRRMGRFYEAWASMKARCGNPNRVGYAAYGGRGIQVCEEWRKSFQEFAKDMGDHPGEGYSLERIDVNKGYYPGNCKWIPTVHQQRNQRRRKLIEYLGRKQILIEWCEELGLEQVLVIERLKRGWSVERAFTEPKIAKYSVTRKSKTASLSNDGQPDTDSPRLVP